jgi:lysozyme
MNRNRLYRTVENDEGFRSKPYKCSNGIWTIGIGRNLESVGLRYSEAKFMMKNDLEVCQTDLTNIFTGQFAALPDHVQEVLMNMRFQLGPGRFRSFKKFIAAIRAWDMTKAKQEMLDSKWAKQDTPDRANRLAKVLQTGY